MATFEITAPDGSVYHIDGANESGAVAALKNHLGGQTAGPAFSSTIPGKTRLSTDAELWAANHPTAAGAMEFLRGVPFVGEYADEFLGKMAPAVGPNSAEDATNILRSSSEAFAKENPKTALGLNIAGGVTGSAIGLAAMPAAIPAAMPTSVGGRVLAGGGIGGLLGGTEGSISGYGSGVDEATRWKNAKSRGLLGSTLGTALGSVAPAVGQVVKSGGRRLLDLLTVSKKAKDAGLSKPSYEILTRAMEADQSFGGRGLRRLNAGGNDAMLADAGPSARGLLDVAIQKSGPAGAAATRAVEQRAANENKTIAKALDLTLGSPRGIKSAEEAIRKGTAGARQSAYDAAYGTPINYATPEADALQQTLKRVPGDVITQANRLMKLDGDKSKQIIITVAQDGSVSYQRLPDVRQLDYISRALNHAAESGEGTGALGGQTAMGRAYQGLSKEIRGAVKDLVPEYKVALDTAAEPIAARNALQFGSKLFSPSMTRDEVAHELRGMSQAELQNARAGVRSFLDEKLSNVTRAVADGNMDAREAISALKSLSSRAAHEKITMLIGQNSADLLFTNLNRAGQALELRAAVAQNSKTFARTEMDRTVREFTEGGVANELRQGKPISAGKRIVQSLLGGTPQARQAAEDRIYSEVTGALTGARGPKARGLLQTLEDISVRTPRSAQIAKRATGLLGQTLLPPAYQTGMQLLGRPAGNRGQQ